MMIYSLGSVFAAILLFFSSLLGGQHMSGAYSFQKVEDNRYLSGGKLMNIIELSPTDYMLQCTRFKGQLLTLFGEPRYETQNLEDQYGYAIACSNREGKTIYLSVYNGPSGPAIGGGEGADDIEEAEEAALALIEAIRAVEPADYEYEGYYPDGPSRVWMGVVKGEPYYREEEITDADEIDQMFALLYNF